MKAVSTAQIRDLDRRTIAAGIPGFELMERAGFAVAKTAVPFLKKRDSRSVLLFAGKGNNGGDVFVAARHLAAAGCHPILFLFCSQDDLKGDSLTHFRQMAKGAKVIEIPTTQQMKDVAADEKPAVIIDGLLGTGIRGHVQDPIATGINFINQSRIPVIAVDVPSGLDSDTGDIHGACVHADVTVTMGLPKIGLLQSSAVDVCGQIEVVDIGFPLEFVNDIQTKIEFTTVPDIAPLFKRRDRDAHKGDFGHLLVIAGSEGYTGAAVLCAHAAARGGAGLVTVAMPRNVYSIVAAQCPPEVMPRAYDDVDGLTRTIDRYTAIAVGPGLGIEDHTHNLVKNVLGKSTVPLVVDADALNIISSNLSLLSTVSVPLILTPHPGEMARLTGKNPQEVQSNRWELAREFAIQNGIVLVLKGAGTVVTDQTGILHINSTGNPGMAKGGMGDVLTGIIGSLLAQRFDPLQGARAGTFVHGLAGNFAAERNSQTSMLATDVIQSLYSAFEILDEQ